MKIRSLILPVITLVVAIFIACTGGEQPVAQETAPAEPRDGVFIHVSHGVDEPHRVLMALRMAELMAADKDVLMYFDITGIQVVLNDAADIEHGEFPGSHEQIQKLLDLGVPLYACPACLAAAGKTPDDLREGIQVAEKDAFFGFTEGRILSLDY